MTATAIASFAIVITKPITIFKTMNPITTATAEAMSTTEVGVFGRSRGAVTPTW